MLWKQYCVYRTCVNYVIAQLLSTFLQYHNGFPKCKLNLEIGIPPATLRPWSPFKKQYSNFPYNSNNWLSIGGAPSFYKNETSAASLSAELIDPSLNATNVCSVPPQDPQKLPWYGRWCNRRLRWYLPPTQGNSGTSQAVWHLRPNGTSGYICKDPRYPYCRSFWIMMVYP